MNNEIIKKIEKFLNKEVTNETVICLFYDVGFMIKDYNNKQLIELELMLKSNYGIVIAFTKRNLKNMIKFYNEIDDINKYKNISWINILKNNLIEYTEDGTLKELQKLKITLDNTK